jgi:replicative DNA helicase
MAQASIEKIILQNLVMNEPFARKVVPFLKKEYFHDRTENFIFVAIQDFIIEYNTLPNIEAIFLSLDKKKSLTQDDIKKTNELSNQIFEGYEECSLDWLMAESEVFCKEKAVYNAIMNSINIIDGKDETPTTSIPDILSKALAVSFDTNIGHDYIEDYIKRYEFTHKIEQKIPFDLSIFNDITSGGIVPKTLNIVLAGTGCGKSLFLCHHAAFCLKQHKNVLYITCEMSEEKIAERIDANILDIAINDLKLLPLSLYEKKIQTNCGGFKGKLIIKEYPTSTASANHFRFLLDELKLKKKFVPDIIFIDYLNICSSSRLRGGKVNSYEYIKSVAEEIRGLAVEYNVPIFTATQTNRDGFSNTDPGLENTSDSFGLPMTADFMFALVNTEELEQAGNLMVKQLKNRYNESLSNRKFLIGINRGKMKLTDLINPSVNAMSLTPKKESNKDFFGQKKTASVNDWTM